MKLRGGDFGCIVTASGTRGFFGEGYWFHRFFRWLGLIYVGATFIAKTMTLAPWTGNTELAADGIAPRRWFPDSIIVKFIWGVVLNAVGLSNSGAEFLLKTGCWQKRTRPFFISFAMVGKTSEERIEEMLRFVQLFKKHLASFMAWVGLKINISCPNCESAIGGAVAVYSKEMYQEIMTLLDIASELGIPLVVKISVLMPVEFAVRILQHPACDGLAISNTIPYGELADRINWLGIFGTAGSPLKRRGYGGGGLSGKWLLPIVCHYLEQLLQQMREAGVQKPIIAGGGVLTCWGAYRLIKRGASAVSIGSVSILRPWRVWRIILFCRIVYALRRRFGKI